MTNAAQAAPRGVPITLGGDEYTLRYDATLIRLMDELAGINGYAVNWANPSPREVHALIWATVERHTRKRHTAEQIDGLMPVDDVDLQREIGQAIAKMLIEVFNERKKKLEAKKARTESLPSSTGSNTGLSAE